MRFKHSWGTAEKLYKSEAIDSFGNKYLLGVYETVKEAEKAFDEWNKEHLGAERFKSDLVGLQRQKCGEALHVMSSTFADFPSPTRNASKVRASRRRCPGVPQWLGQAAGGGSCRRPGRFLGFLN